MMTLADFAATGTINPRQQTHAYIEDPMEDLAAAIEASESGRKCSIPSPCQSESAPLMARTLAPLPLPPSLQPSPSSKRARAPRADRGEQRRSGPPKVLVSVPLADHSINGTDMPAPKRKKNAPLSWAYLPAGVQEALPRWTVAAFTNAALDFLDEMSRGDRAKYRPARWEHLEARYGQVRLDKLEPRELVAGTPYTGPDRPRVWDIVREALKAGKFIEVKESEYTDADRVAMGAASHVRRADRAAYRPKVSAIKYRLCQQWREAPLCRVALAADYAVDDAKVTLSDGQPILVPQHLAQGLLDVGFDLDGALAFIRERAGAELPETQDHAGWVAAILAGQPPAWALEEVAAIEREPDDARTLTQMVHDSALAALAHIWRWRVDGRWSRRHAGPCFRDPRGHRLHSAVTSLEGSLRRFLSFNGERLMQIDCANSQMVILAGALLAAHPDAEDGHDFASVCAAGRFYEESHKVANGTDVDPTPAQRKVWKSASMGAFLYCEAYIQNRGLGLKLAQRWPTLHLYMTAEKAGDSSKLPCKMQQREAAIWIDALAPELEAAGIPVVTVHDSALFPASRAAEVESIVRRLYRDAGLRAEFVVGSA